MKSIAMVFGVSAISVLASTASVLADDSVLTASSDRSASVPVLIPVSMQQQRSFVVDPLTGKTVVLATTPDSWRVRPVTFWLSMGTGF